MKRLIIDVVHSSTSRELSKYMQVDAHMLPSQQEPAKLISDYDVLVMRIGPTIDKEILDVAKNLKMVGVCSAGLNYVDLETTKVKGIQVFNVPDLNANAVAELILSKMLDIARHTTPTDADVKINRNWDEYKFAGSELRGKTLGILGLGRIGRYVGGPGRTFLMNVVAYNPFLKSEDFEKENAKDMDIGELLKVFGYTSIHIPLTPGTKNLFNIESIAKMKSGTIALNMGHDGIVNEQGMYEALKANKIGGYATGVMENELATDDLGEGAPFDFPLFECDSFIVTSHLSAWSSDASHDVGVFITVKLREALDLN